MIGSAAGLTFMDFVANTGLVAVASVLVLIVIMKFLYGRKLAADPKLFPVAHLDENKAIEDHALLVKRRNGCHSGIRLHLPQPDRSGYGYHRASCAAV